MRRGATPTEKINKINRISNLATLFRRWMVQTIQRRHQVYGPKKPFKRAEEKLGRNDPCPCGSGRKYKQCCLDQKEKA